MVMQLKDIITKDIITIIISIFGLIISGCAFGFSVFNNKKVNKIESHDKRLK